MTTGEGEQVETQDDPIFVGYTEAGEYTGLARNTLSSYVARGIGPEMEDEREARGQYNLPRFRRSKLDAWMRSRPGQGARTDLTPAS